MPPISKYPLFTGKLLSKLPCTFEDKYVLLQSGDLYRRKIRCKCEKCKKKHYKWVKFLPSSVFLFLDTCTNKYLTVGVQQATNGQFASATGGATFTKGSIKADFYARLFEKVKHPLRVILSASALTELEPDFVQLDSRKVKSEPIIDPGIVSPIGEEVISAGLEGKLIKDLISDEGTVVKVALVAETAPEVQVEMVSGVTFLSPQKARAFL